MSRRIVRTNSQIMVMVYDRAITLSVEMDSGDILELAYEPSEIEVMIKALQDARRKAEEMGVMDGGLP